MFIPLKNPLDHLTLHFSTLCAQHMKLLFVPGKHRSTNCCLLTAEPDQPGGHRKFERAIGVNVCASLWLYVSDERDSSLYHLA